MAATGGGGRRQRHPEPLHVGRVRRPAGAQLRRVRQRRRVDRLQLERRGDRKAAAPSGGTSGYDIVVPTGVYIPQMASDGLSTSSTCRSIPNFEQLDPIYPARRGIPTTCTRCCKDWGSTGWIYDNTVITEPLNTWSDFLAAAEGPASGKTSVLDTAAERHGPLLLGQRHRLDHDDPADLDACEDYIVNTLAPHIKAFDSYPGINLTQGTTSSRRHLERRRAPGSAQRPVDDPEQYTWGLGAPETELWMDNWCIVKGPRTPTRLRVDQLHPRPRELAQGPRVPRLQHRDQGHRGGGGRADLDVPRPGLLHARAGRRR